MTTINYKGYSIEKERDGSWSAYLDGNPFATLSGFNSLAAIKARIDFRMGG